jgi:hypothetical protein
MGCKKCGREARVKRLSANRISVQCCGITEEFTSKSRGVWGNKDFQGRLHGPQPTFGTGEVHYQHGIMTYLDDGNGNVFDEATAYDRDEEFDGP